MENSIVLYSNELAKVNVNVTYHDENSITGFLEQILSIPF